MIGTRGFSRTAGKRIDLVPNMGPNLIPTMSYSIQLHITSILVPM